MMKSLYIAEKPSVAQEFAKALNINAGRRDGYLESEEAVVTWCVGHLVTMSYPEKYDEKYKKWRLETLPFLPEKFLYEVIPGVSKQFKIVKELLTREDVGTIYVCTDSGREGEYIYRLVDMMVGVTGKTKKRVWIDSQTEEEILRGIREAKDLSAYDSLAASAYLRAKEDYLMGINFSRVLSLKYGAGVAAFQGTHYQAISVGRVMTCVLGMIVRREREIRDFKKTAFYRVLAQIEAGGTAIEGEWRVCPESLYYGSPVLYKENGFLKKEDARRLIQMLEEKKPVTAIVNSIERKTEKKNPPLLYNLAELQNDCSRMLKISPDQTLKIAQELYEKKLTTYPRTDARVLSTAVAKEISSNLRGLRNYELLQDAAGRILEAKTYQNLAKTRYVNDKQITDHYAIIPTGQGMSALTKLSDTSRKVYELIARRFLGIFYPHAEYKKVSLTVKIGKEAFFFSERVLSKEGFLAISRPSFLKQKDEQGNPNLLQALAVMKKGQELPVQGFNIKEGETSPPKRYNSGSMILAMENAGQLIEDEELREQIRGSGIGTSATRAEILKKLTNIKYISLNKKTQVITPTLLGENIHDVVLASIRSLLNPELTASWEKGLTYVADGSITEEEYMQKLEKFVRDRTNLVKGMNNQYQLRGCFERNAQFYRKKGTKKNG